jgi:predicted PurR-regulated permease PerM
MRAMNLNLNVRWICGALIVAVSAWVLHPFVQALLAACVAAVASWPLYRRFRARVSPRIPRAAVALIFTGVVTLFVLAPVVFALGALAVEAREMLLDLASPKMQGIAAPFFAWTQRADPAAYLGHAQMLGQFMVRHLLLVAFAILVLFFLYQEGDTIVRDLRRLLRHRIGDHADAYAMIATRAVRSSVNSMLVVALFDGLAAGIAYYFIGVPHAALWAAITGTLALVPFLGYAAVVAVALRLAITAGVSSAVLSLVLGVLVILSGDKIVRPLVAGDGTRLSFVWILMGCLGGFEALGFVGLVIGPVALALTREIWLQRVRGLASEAASRRPPANHLPARKADCGLPS